MDKELFQLLSTISAGTALKWIIIIIGLISAFVVFIIKCYEAIEKWRKLKNTEEKKDKNITEAATAIADIQAMLKVLNDKIDVMVKESRKIDKTQIRHSIVRSCLDALEKGNIDPMQLQTLEDLYAI